MALGDNIRRIRVNKGMTLGDLSVETGVKLGQLSKIELNNADPKASTLYKILNALDCSADSVFMDQEKTGVKGVLKEAFESASKLPGDDQITLINIVEKFCIANGLNTMLNEHRVLINIAKKGEDRTPALLKEENTE